MKELNDEMEARFEGMGRRPMPEWWVKSGRTELSWWELTDTEQIMQVVEQQAVVVHLIRERECGTVHSKHLVSMVNMVQSERMVQSEH